MKKLFFAVVLTALTVTTLNAQKFGAKAGLNIAKYNYSGENTSEVNDKLKSLIGFHVGGFAEFEITEKFAFQPELLYSAQGVKSENSDTVLGVVYSSESTIKTSYINIPLMAKYYVIEGLSVQAGPQVGFLMSADATTSNSTGGITQNSTSTDVKDQYKGIDFGLNFGVGYKLDFGLFFDARYNLGLSDLADKRVDGDDNKSTNRVIQISVGYSFN